MVVICWFLLIGAIFLALLAYGVATLPERWANSHEREDRCVDYAHHTGFQTRWVRYDLDNSDCLVKLDVQSADGGDKWLPIEDLHVVVTKPVP